MRQGRGLIEQRVLQLRDNQGADDYARDTAHAAEHDHTQDGDGDLKGKILRVDRAEPAAVDHARETGEERAYGEGQQLGAGQVDAHARRRNLILADGDPGTSEP